MDFAFGPGNPLENSNRFFLHPRRQCAFKDHLPNDRKASTVRMFMLVIMIVVMMVMLMTVMVVVILMMMILMFMVVLILMRMMMVMIVIVSMDVELHPFDARFLFALGVNVPVIERKFAKFVLQFIEGNTQIEERADEHVATDSTENIQVKSFHNFPAASALIWLAA